MSRGIFSRRDHGAALVEFAILLPILVLLIMGMVEFGRGYNAQITLTQASREGVRILAITKDASQAVTATENVAATSLDITQLTVTTTACNSGDPTSLTASYPFTYDIPLWETATITLSATGVMRCGG
jgi:Flp pilus assembly protein TadG